MIIRGNVETKKHVEKYRIKNKSKYPLLSHIVIEGRRKGRRDVYTSQPLHPSSLIRVIFMDPTFRDDETKPNSSLLNRILV